MNVDLRGNIKSVGSVFLTAAKGVQGRSLVRRTVAVEDDAPWRRGQGWGLLLVPGVVLTVGTWAPDTDPNLVVEARDASEHATRIPRWAHIATLSMGPDRPARQGQAPEGWTIVPMPDQA